jgi:DNA-binding transcriptional MerR regulator
MNTDRRLSIGTLAQAAGVRVVTIRYYERIQLMPVPPRTEGNYRVYREEHLHRLRFIRRCRDLGFTLDQIRRQPRPPICGPR